MESQQKVSRGIAELAVWHVDSVQAAKARIEERFDDLDWLMAQESLTKSPQDGPIIGDWSRAKRFLKDGPDRLVKLKIEGQLCLDQIDHLMTDIRSNVERDLEGTPSMRRTSNKPHQKRFTLRINSSSPRKKLRDWYVWDSSSNNKPGPPLTASSVQSELNGRNKSLRIHELQTPSFRFEYHEPREFVEGLGLHFFHGLGLERSGNRLGSNRFGTC